MKILLNIKLVIFQNPNINIAVKENQNQIPLSKPNTIKLLLPKKKPDPGITIFIFINSYSILLHEKNFFQFIVKDVH